MRKSCSLCSQVLESGPDSFVEWKKKPRVSCYPIRMQVRVTLLPQLSDSGKTGAERSVGAKKTAAAAAAFERATSLSKQRCVWCIVGLLESD